jgi:DNA-binding transcriptional LysR family regulator
MNISWDDARLFLAVADNGSFNHAARRVGLAQPTLSRRVAQLEFQLGLTLFHRGKRGTTLSADGERLLPAARQMARWATELERAVAGREQAPVGSVRLTAPPGIAFDFVVPFARELRRAQPRLRLDLIASVAHLDLSRGDADLAIRTRAPREPELTALGSITFPVAVFGHQDYVATLPKNPELADLDWVTWCYPNEHLPPRPELEAAIADFSPVFASDDYVIQKRAVELGLGVMILGNMRHPLVADTGLVQVPVQLPLPLGELHLVCATSMAHVPRVRAVGDALLREFERVESC